MDVNKRNWLMNLLNCCVSQHLRRFWIRPDSKGRHFFVPSKEGGDRLYEMGKGQKSRTVAKQITNPQSKQSFWVHHAARIKFKRLGKQLFLAIEPVYLFTENGYINIKGKQAGKFSQMWAGRQQNPDILRNVLFWGFVLANRRQTISVDTGASRILIDSIPAGTLIPRGIRSDTIRIKTLMAFESRELDKAADDIEEIDEIEEDEDEEPQED